MSSDRFVEVIAVGKVTTMSRLQLFCAKLEVTTHVVYYALLRDETLTRTNFSSDLVH